ncbi:TolC family protein [Tundrisphaera lichenicola]|uniref:TolC family protein n=1 Tax=Tundrisphaera lichenicola TaxID=2029860 RepID=UPI003EC0D369
MIGSTRPVRGPGRRCMPAILSLVVMAAGGSIARGQGMNAGAGSGGPPGAGLGGARGSAVDPDPGGSPDDPGQFGGIRGGQGGQGGTVGSPSRSGLKDSPGDPDESLFGPPIGASGTTGRPNSPGTQPPGFLGGRLGPTAIPDTRPGGDGGPGSNQALRKRLRRDREGVQPSEIDPFSLARRPGLDIPEPEGDAGPEDGLTLDLAIDQVLRQNLTLMAQRFEIPKAEADVLTAGLRNNPIVYGDAQFVPYGKYTQERPGGGGGQPQYDVNFSFPLDVTGKRHARVAVARMARRVTEAQFQDAARQLIDDLYGAFINVLAARETLRYGEAFLEGITRIRGQAEARARQAPANPAPEGDEAARKKAEDEREAAEGAIVELKSQEKQSRLQVRQAGRELARTTRTLAQILNVPPTQAESLRIRGRLRVPAPPTIPADELVRTALASRPDLIAYRLGVSRSQADVKLARANRFSDVYLVYQPYTFQDGKAFGYKATYSWGAGVNATLPLFNRNQGNIARAECNARQTQVEMAALEQQASHEVREAALDVELGLADVVELERDVIPAARQARDRSFGEFRDDPSKVGDYLDDQKDYNDVVQQYRNALIELRQSQLDLNTAVGLRVMP